MGKRRNISCDVFKDAKLPPCTEFLGSYNPLLKDGKIMYRNYNRLYFFLTFNSIPNSSIKYNPNDPLTYTSTVNGNVQISPYDFFIGFFINEIQKGNIKYNPNKRIHDDSNADKFIKEVLENDYEINNIFIPSLSYSISNSNAILPLYYNNFTISLINYYIVIILSRFYGDYGLLYANNSYVTGDCINYELANIYREFSNY